MAGKTLFDEQPTCYDSHPACEACNNTGGTYETPCKVCLGYGWLLCPLCRRYMEKFARWCDGVQKLPLDERINALAELVKT